MVFNNLIQEGLTNNLVSRTVSNAPQDSGFNIGNLIGAFWVAVSNLQEAVSIFRLIEPVYARRSGATTK